ncbi:DMT family transporter [Dokdonella fugitiva]|jgi:drug/metabolite transporter (DMT)-like permease|uniref:Threonine/homoserine efflux transporter RhtA n=1 Tax=Dokdonella fugitiva TaxID=328517 RepID=A0A4R2I424_9GAMM|nr:DMT family transporter [Dokdonella fugitiva]MBA8884216.1 drug/metabolite transporter (DMT)-like permease [Dokdonella fugitiva]TCO38903.1 threonine/homoserine efflux transporter RhtA [Dokdonella fugitiva]
MHGTHELPRRALLQMIVGAVAISTTSLFVKIAHVGPTMSGFYRMGFGGLMLLGGLVALGQWRRLRLAEVGWLLVPGAAFAIDLVMWHRSILYVGPGLATLLGNFQVFLMALAGWLIYRERLGWHFLAGIVLAFVGLYLLVGLDWSAVGAQYRLGVVLGAVTGVAYAVYMLSTRHAQRAGHVKLAPAQLLCVSSLLSAVVLGVVAAAEGESFVIPDAQSWSALLGLAFFGQVFGWVLLTRAMPQLPASTIGLLLLLQPALSFILDVLLFARPTRTLDWVGVALSLLGIFIGSYRSAARAPTARHMPA